MQKTYLKDFHDTDSLKRISNVFLHQFYIDNIHLNQSSKVTELSNI